MNTPGTPISELRVEDVMQRHVVTLSLHATMEEAAKVLCQHEISGAPVVDEMGRCVGVLTAGDFTLRNEEEEDGGLVPHRDCEFQLATNQIRGPMKIQYTPEDRVERHMTAAIQTVTAEQSLVEAARYMSSGHVSRLVVVDADGRPVGIVGALDLLATWVREVDASG